MAYLAGFLSKLGMRIESAKGLIDAVYPTTEALADAEEVKLASYDLVPMISESIDDAHEFENDESIIGNAGVIQSDRVSREPSGTIVVQGMYDGMDAGIACALGAEKWNSPDYTVGTEKTGTDGAISGDGPILLESLSNTFTAADTGKYIRFNTSGDVDLLEGRVQLVQYHDEHRLLINALYPKYTNLGFELANEFKHTFVPVNNLEDVLWKSIFSDYPTTGAGTANDLMIRRMTIGIAKAVSLWVYRSCMVNTMRISGSAKSGIQFEFGILPFDRVTDSLAEGRQAGTTIETWKKNLKYSSSTLFTPVTNERILFSDLTFRVDDYSTSTGLTSADNVGISSFEINVNNNLDTSTHDSISGEYRRVPLRNGKREVSGSITIPRYTADNLISKISSDTIQMAHFNFVGSTISTIQRAFQIWLPSLKFTSHNEQIGGAGIVQSVLGFQCYVPAGQAKDFPTYPVTNPNPDIIIQTTNQNPFSMFRKQNTEY